MTNGRSAGYTPNSLNQYVSRAVPGYVNVVGEAKTDTTVAVNGQSAGRQGTFYHRELTVANSASPVFLTTEVTGTRGSDVATRQGKVFVPKTPESFTHDADGNLLSDGRWNYTWDGENRLIAQETTTAAAAAGTPRVRLSFTYDYMGRRTSKKLERNWGGSSYQDSYTMLFVWDGWNMVAEVLQGGPRVRTYVWGLDLSGSPQGAGGVGGLLFINQYPENKNYAVGYDGNGNVTALFDMAEQGSLAAHYEYGPFGEPLVVTGPYANVNPFRWSTKYTDDESGLVFYGGNETGQGRHYEPPLGRFLSRDPIGELGGPNLYPLGANDPINNVDPFGLDFIAVGSGKAGSWPTIIGRHLSVTYWKDDIKCIEEDDYKKGSKWSRRKGGGRASRVSSVGNNATPAGYIELDIAWALTDYYHDSPQIQGTRKTSVPISYIISQNRGTSAADTFVVIYADKKGGPEDAKQKWSQIQSAANRYGFAHHGLPRPGTSVGNWPNSVYAAGGGFGNNSNTLIYYLTSQIGRSPDVLDRFGYWHPGNQMPQPVGGYPPGSKAVFK